MHAPASTILIVEDDPRLRRWLANQLERRGWCVVTAATVAMGRHALAAGTPGGYDVLLLDLGLPDGTGFEVAAAAPDVPAVVITGREVTLQERLRYQPARVLYKPVGLAELFTLLDRFGPPAAIVNRKAI